MRDFATQKEHQKVDRSNSLVYSPRRLA